MHLDKFPSFTVVIFNRFSFGGEMCLNYHENNVVMHKIHEIGVSKLNK